MEDQRKNERGYKQTKLGWIPTSWNIKPFSDLFCRMRQPVIVELKTKYYEIGIRSHGKGIFHKKPIRGSDLGNKSVFWVQPNSLIFNIVFAWEQAVAITSDNEKGMIASHRFPMYKGNGRDVEIKFIYWFLLSKRGKHFLGLASPGGAGRNKTLGQGELKHLFLPHPPVSEQKKIADILSTWSSAVYQTRKLITAKKNFKNALVQLLLEGKKRLPGFKAPWKEVFLGQIFTERNETNCDHLPLLAITGKRGVILASEIDRKDSSSTNKSRYKRIIPGDIGYNTMRMWQGVSAVSKLEGVVSPAYTICKPKNDVDVLFIGYLFKSPPVVQLFWRYSQGLVSDTLNLKFHHFAQIKIKIPNIEEQKSIARFLMGVDVELKFHQKKLSALEKQKRGLMQKLLTGKVRVNT